MAVHQRRYATIGRFLLGDVLLCGKHANSLPSPPLLQYHSLESKSINFILACPQADLDVDVWMLGWEFQFLVPISGTPIGGGIPIPFTIPKILVGIIFLKF
jgi:hypothetical protein